MRHRRIFAAFAVAAIGCLPARAQVIAPTPPMGWNSWDAYGFTIDEAGYKANATVLATLKAYGWRYAVIDEGWYMADPLGNKLATRGYQIDGNGLLVPSTARFPSAADGAGFKPLADWAHAQGLQFGIHIVRGIPKDAVARNTPIDGTIFHAADAADTTDLCGWDDGNFGVRDNAAGQAYYDSMMRLYARWGVDLLKVDCIADHPYKPTEIRQIAAAIQKTGRPIVLSLSPGPAQIAHAGEIAAEAQMWRISDDIWDGWRFAANGPDTGFPMGVASAFDNLAKWSVFAKPGNWPDADMLPIGSLMPHPGWGEPRESRLTQDERRTQITLWSMARSPLILGANLTRLDDATRALLSNKDVTAIDQTAWESHPVDLPKGLESFRVWTASAGSHDNPTRYVAIFNLGDKPADFQRPWAVLGLRGSHNARELWTGALYALDTAVWAPLPAHGCVVLQVY